MHYLSRACLLKSNKFLVTKTQFFQTRHAGKLEHGRWSAHEDLRIFGRAVKQAISLNHIFRNKSRRKLPFSGGVVQGVVKSETIRELLEQLFQLWSYQNIILGCKSIDDLADSR
jgi:hypothetical protein